MNPFDDRDTISVPLERRPSWMRRQRRPVRGLRVRGTRTRHDLPRRSDPINVGAGASCDLVIADDPHVSARHCVLCWHKTGELLIRDSGSRNGTYVNQHRCQRGLVTDRTQILIGTTTLIAYSDDTRHVLTAFERLETTHETMHRARRAAVRAATHDGNVLLVGEPGTGKGLLARLIHEESRRAAGPFVRLRCTGRRDMRAALFDAGGALARADGGTLYLEDIGRLDRALQVELARAMYEGRLRVAKGAVEIPIDVRLVTATTEPIVGPPESALATAIIAVPPVRERWTDVPVLVFALLEELAGGAAIPTVPAAEMAALCGYDWPGNVAQLRDALQAAVEGGATRLTVAQILPSVGRAGAVALRRRAVERALATHQTTTAAAAALHVPRTTLLGWLRAFRAERE